MVTHSELFLGIDTLFSYSFKLWVMYLPESFVLSYSNPQITYLVSAWRPEALCLATYLGLLVAFMVDKNLNSLPTNDMGTNALKIGNRKKPWVDYVFLFSLNWLLLQACDWSLSSSWPTFWSHCTCHMQCPSLAYEWNLPHVWGRGSCRREPYHPVSSISCLIGVLCSY